ncbi:MAG TPA: FimV/HubP family polar landmark protein [Rhodanobacter sp.]
MNRSLKLSMLMALALGSSQVLALDLGQIQVKSALGQPLLAEIPLHPANPAELQNLTIQLASSEEFARAGITGGRTTIPLHFSVANAGSDHPVIRITSSVAVDDPYLDLLIEVNSHAAGKSVREFAILLDPPGTSSAASTAAAQTRVERRSEPVAPRRPAAATPAAAPKPARAASPAPAAATATVANGQYGPVEHGQTLSSIARSTAPSGVDVQQMMLALKQANPDAFYHDNINALKSGAVLRVPTSAEAQAMTIAAAVAEVRRQNSDWRAGTPGKPAVVADAATRAAASSAPGNASAGGGDRLALVPAKDLKEGAAQAGGHAGDKADKSAASLRQDLLRTQESLASLQQQGADLKTRLKDLTDINTKNEHLLSLKDSEIAELQNKLAAARKAAGMPAPAPASAATTPKPAASTSVAAASSQAKPEAAPAGTVANAGAAPVAAGSTTMTAAPAVAASSAPAHTSTAVAVAPVAAKPAVKHVAPAPRPAPMIEQPWYMQTWAWAAGAGAIVVLLLLALLGRRRKPAAALAGKSAASLADRFGTASAGHGFTGGDDVDQEELLDQLAEHPDDIGLHLELVTLYYSRRDVEHFEAAAEAMHAHITDPQQDEWQDVVHMGEDLVPGHPLFDHHPELPGHEETEARRAFDIDDYAAGGDAVGEASSMPPPLPSQGPKKVSEYSFNFDLTHPVAINAASHQPDAADHADVAVPPAKDTHVPELHEAPAAEATSWHFDDAANTHHMDSHDGDLGEFNDDPVDTKLDLARAYLDMGDADGARAMLSEVMKEGSQMQKDVAKRLLDNLH